MCQQHVRCELGKQHLKDTTWSVRLRRIVLTPCLPVCRDIGHTSCVYLNSIDNAHVHASLAGMVQEGTVEAPSHCLIASEGEGNVGDAPADLAPWALPLDLPGGANEVDSVVVVL